MEQPIASVENDDLTETDMVAFITAAIKTQGLVSHCINGFNEFIDHGVHDILTNLFRLRRVIENEHPQRTAADPADYEVTVHFHDVELVQPRTILRATGQQQALHPAQARMEGLPYSSPLFVSATIKVRASYADGREDEKTGEISRFQIGSLPIMVGSSQCHTRSETPAALKKMREDPTDLGGYFIAKRSEWIVEHLENICYNKPHVHVGIKENEYARAEFLSQPPGAFENSSQLRIYLLRDGKKKDRASKIMVEINSLTFKNVRLPFYLIYRMFGMTSDREIAETIVFDVEGADPLTHQMLGILEVAFHEADPPFDEIKYEINHAAVVEKTSALISRYNKSSAQADEALARYRNTSLLRSLDGIILPHMGKTEEARAAKLRMIGLIIHRMFLVHLGVLPPTDRDSFQNKRAHGPGVSLAKAFKSQVNNSIVVPLMSTLRRELRNNTWAAISGGGLAAVFNQAINGSDLERAMNSAIVAGNVVLTTRQRRTTNRVSSHQLERKNPLNVISSNRIITTAQAGKTAKQTERADKMRRVPATGVGYICVSQSADTGEAVGKNKQLAVTATVCTAGDPLALKMVLAADPAFEPLDRVTGPEMKARGLARVFINGEWVGFCGNAYELATRYRARRRACELDPFTTIYVDPITPEVQFWLDVGRLCRPLLIVDNNAAEYEAACMAAGAAAGAVAGAVQFVQNVRFTRRHVAEIKAGRLDLDALVRAGVAEYITPEEQENCLLAESFAVLRAARHDPSQRFTHCDVPQAIFGLAAHMSPFGNHTQPARVTYETNQTRQTCTWYNLAHPFRADKNKFFQYYVAQPLVTTLTNRYIVPNGYNAIVALASYGGDNQEDSAIVNKASADRGLFDGAFFRYEEAILEKGEKFCNPDLLNTKNVKQHACYEKLENGFIRKGSVVNYGDVLIGRVYHRRRAGGTGRAGPAPDGAQYLYEDRSIVYQYREPAVVDDVVSARGANDGEFVVVKLRLERPLRVGDKFSSRSGNKAIVSKLCAASDMPFTEGGIQPDAIINTHAFPSRMTVGQLIESSFGLMCALLGYFYDGTPFLPVDVAGMLAVCEAHGLRYNGTERMYNGETGEYFDAAIFIGPIALQRLQKFVLDDKLIVAGSGTTDATTGQPLAGSRVHGGLRIGEMEHWVLASHGSVLNLAEKTLVDSDYRTAPVCRNCGNIAVRNEFHNLYSCIRCGEMADISDVNTCKTAVLLLEELEASNIHVGLGLAPRTFDR